MFDIVDIASIRLPYVWVVTCNGCQCHNVITIQVIGSIKCKLVFEAL